MKILRVFFYGLSLCVFSACIGKAVAEPPAPEKPYEPSPFAGHWVAVESDADNAFKLHIRQENHQLLAHYCVVQRRGEWIECGDTTDHFLTFIADCPSAATFETPYIAYASAKTGRARLILRDGALFWKVLEAPDGPCAVWKQARMIRE